MSKSLLWIHLTDCIVAGDNHKLWNSKISIFCYSLKLQLCELRRNQSTICYAKKLLISKGCCLGYRNDKFDTLLAGRNDKIISDVLSCVDTDILPFIVVLGHFFVIVSECFEQKTFWSIH